MSSTEGSLPRTRNHGYAALAREDVPDAKRGHPDVELGDYAARHGLEVLRGAMAAGFRAALPVFEEYRFNVLRGLLPGGCYGLMFHELMEVPHRGSASMSGRLYGVYARTPGRWRLRDLLPDRSDIPIVGELLSDLQNPREDTSPPTVVRHRKRLDPVHGRGDPRARGDATASLLAPRPAPPPCPLRLRPPPQARQRRAAGLAPARGPGAIGRAAGAPVWGPLRDLLRRREDRFFQLLVLRGTLIARRNGFGKTAQRSTSLPGTSAWRPGRFAGPACPRRSLGPSSSRCPGRRRCKTRTRLSCRARRPSGGRPSTSSRHGSGSPRRTVSPTIARSPRCRCRDAPPR